MVSLSPVTFERVGDLPKGRHTAAWLVLEKPRAADTQSRACSRSRRLSSAWTSLQLYAHTSEVAMEIPLQQDTFQKTFLISRLGLSVTRQVFHISCHERKGVSDGAEQLSCWEGSAWLPGGQ